MNCARLKLTCFLCIAVATFARGATVTNVNRAGPECLSGAGGSYLPTFSEEGWSIAFLSHANNLVTNDDSGLALDVFLADVSGPSMELISVNRSRVGGGNADSMHPLASRYGTMIVFASRSSNLTTNDTNNAVDLFLRQRMTVAVTETRLITSDRFGRGLVDPTPYSARPLSTHPVLGTDVFPDIVFQSSGTNLVNAPISRWVIVPKAVSFIRGRSRGRVSLTTLSYPTKALFRLSLSIRKSGYLNQSSLTGTAESSL